MIVNPGIRRFLGSAIQRLFNSASVSLPLTHTAVPTRGSITPTFVRATTETGQKWDEAGYLDFTALAGEIVFKGARREYNQLPNGGTYKSSGLFNNWTKFGAPVVTDGFAGPTGTLTAGRVVMDATEAIYTIGSNGAGRTGQIAVWLRGDVAGTIKLSAANSGASTTCNVTTEWAQYSVPAFAMTNADGISVQRANAGQLETVYIDLAQIVDITGETDQTTIRPYVSVGVESAPAYHGACVDGVLYSDLDRSGNPISTSGSYPLVGYVPWEARTNLLLQSAVVATQSITVAAVAHTLSFKGTGTITLSGVSAAGPLVGTGANDRVTLTFTPTAGSLTLTVSGSCTVGQLEAGSFATPYIPTTTVAVARNANLLTYSNTGTISASEGTVYAELSTAYTVASGYKDAISSAAGTGAQILGIGNAAASTTRFTIDGSTLTTKSGLSDMSTGTRKTAVTWGGSTYSITGDGVAPTSAAFDGSMTVTASFGVGCNAAGTGQWNGNVRNVRIWNRKLSASELQAITA